MGCCYSKGRHHYYISGGEDSCSQHVSVRMESSLIEEECKKQSGNCMSVSICLIMVNGLGELIADLYVLSANRYH
jgi:hypothetical protein